MPPSQADHVFILRQHRELASALSKESDPAEVLRLGLQAAIEVARAECGGVYLLDAHTGDVDMVEHQGLSPEFVQAARHYPAGSANAALVLAGETLYTDYSALPLPKDDPGMVAGLRSFCLIPLRAADRVVGCLNVASSILEVFPEHSKDAMAVVAGQLGSALARQQAERDHLAQEQRFQALFEALAEGMVLHEWIYEDGEPVNFRILDVNPAFEAHTGMTREAVVGKLGNEAYGTEQPPYLQEFGTAKYGGAPSSFETYFPPMDKHFQISVVSPSPGQFATLFFDITNHKRAEAILEQHRQQLEDLVSERTAVLEATLTEKAKLIEDLEVKAEELERFTYTVSHDLKNPLITITGFLGMVRQGLARGELEDIPSDLDRIGGAAQRMHDLLDELLELSRIGRLCNAPERMPASQLIAEALETVTGPVTKAGAKVVLHPAEISVYGDIPRLREVLENLISNAVRYMGDQPAPVVEVGVVEVLGRPALFVRDNGMGILPRFHERIFDLFEQLDATKAGTGIGLAIAKRVVEVHEGRIWVESEGVPGQGSTFFFTLAHCEPIPQAEAP